jgi:hypothetical protein
MNNVEDHDLDEDRDDFINPTQSEWAELLHRAAAIGLPITPPPIPRNMATRTLDLRNVVPRSDQAIVAEPKETHSKMEDAMWEFAKQLKEHIATILSYSPGNIHIRHTLAATIDFSNDRMGSISILIPHASECLQMFVKTPAVNKTRFRFPQFNAAQQLIFKDRSCLIAGASSIFVAYANPEIFTLESFKPFIVQFGKTLDVNLFAVGKLLGNLMTERIKLAWQAYGEVTAAIATLERTLEQKRIALRTVQSEIATSQLDAAAMNDKAQETINMLQRLQGKGKRYQSITFASDTTSVTGMTNMVVVAHRGVSYRLGIYRVTVNLSRQRVSIVNTLSSCIRQAPGSPGGGLGYHHPHILGDSICWGNAGTAIQDMLKKNELYGLFFTIGNYLNDYNESNPYLQIENWERATGAEVANTKASFESQDYEGLASETDPISIPGASTANEVYTTDSTAVTA